MKRAAAHCDSLEDGIVAITKGLINQLEHFPNLNKYALGGLTGALQCFEQKRGQVSPCFSALLPD